MRDPIELDLDCGLLIFEDGEWRLRASPVRSLSAFSLSAWRRLFFCVLSSVWLTACGWNWCTDGGDAGKGGGEGSVKELTELKRKNKLLGEENNMLKYKMEVLIGARAPAAGCPIAAPAYRRL